MKRLTDDELLILLNDTESDRAERKESFSKSVSKANRELEKNANPKLEFEVNQSTVQCIIRKKL